MPEPRQHAALDCRAESSDSVATASWRVSRQGQETRAYRALFSRAIVAALNALIWIYQHTLSPAFAVVAPTCGCRFAPTCSHYAQDALREHGVFTGLALTLRRLAKCGPWHPGGLDPVPPASSLRSSGPRSRKRSCTRVVSTASADHSLLPAHR